MRKFFLIPLVTVCFLSSTAIAEAGPLRHRVNQSSTTSCASESCKIGGQEAGPTFVVGIPNSTVIQTSQTVVSGSCSNGGVVIQGQVKGGLRARLQANRANRGCK